MKVRNRTSKNSFTFQTVITFECVHAYVLRQVSRQRLWQQFTKMTKRYQICLVMKTMTQMTLNLLFVKEVALQCLCKIIKNIFVDVALTDLRYDTVTAPRYHDRAIFTRNQITSFSTLPGSCWLVLLAQAQNQCC